ncbi:hypothetical protein ABT294_44050 [Nonomuraea sp. NPDC000554]|uniref:hypothetical protein n=1 Tax=Nonomuraea sp. NPDC000554 TaxID=3154259 RepID=UPI003331D1D8
MSRGRWARRRAAAARSAAEQRRTTFHATESTVTIGIYGPDAAARVTCLRAALAARDDPR